MRKTTMLLVVTVLGAPLPTASTLIADPADKGCCVIKCSPAKPTWDWTDDTARSYCAKTANDLSCEYDFFKDRKCRDVKNDAAPSQKLSHRSRPQGSEARPSHDARPQSSRAFTSSAP